MFMGTVNYFDGASLYYSLNGEEFMPIDTNGLGMRAAYVWSMTRYDDRVYVGTFNLGGNDSFDHPSHRTGRFGLLSLDPDNLSTLIEETDDAFGTQCYQDGIRNMVAHDDRLIFGTAGNTPGIGTYVFEGQA